MRMETLAADPTSPQDRPDYSASTTTPHRQVAEAVHNAVDKARSVSFTPRAMPQNGSLDESRSSCPPVSTALGGMLSGMAGRKTSVSFDDETLDILARRAKEEGMDRSAYLARLVRRDDLQRRIAADSATLNAAGYTPERATAVTAALIARRRAVG